MDELLSQFLVEGRDLIAEAHTALAVLRTDPFSDGEIDRAFRAVHTLKGSVAIFAMAPAERLLHAAEDLLQRARGGQSPLGADEISQLVATIDQLDRWIDEMEAHGALGSDAAATAAVLLGDHLAEAEPESRGLTAPPAWAEALIAREASALSEASGMLVAFRYTPDGEAFFRGDDPLNLVATVPDLIALSVRPAGDAWPESGAIDPFACFMQIEGISGASLADLQAAFRLVPDQIALHPFESAVETEGTSGLRASPTLRVEAARVDALADGLGELIVRVNAIAPLADRAEEFDANLAGAIRGAHADLQRAVNELRGSVAAVRMVPLAPTLRRLPRLVREIAADLGKQVEFALTGERAEVDKLIADALFEPLLHLIRNAIDHGIETPAQREGTGKSPTGQVSLSIGREGEEVIVTLADDGGGIDARRIRSVAVERGVLPADAAEGLSEAATLALIFTPGFSTASAISDVSGRGVGMDAVRTAIDSINGRIEVDSRVGEGTRFILRLPANAITTKLLIVRVGHDRYAVPFEHISETVRVGAERLVPVGTGTACVLRDRTVPVLSLAELLGGAGSGTLPARLLVTCLGGEPVALRVDGFGERLDAIVRRPAGLLAGMASVAGTAVTGDGGVLLVLNLPELVAWA